MTHETMNLQALLGKSADADFLREMFGFAAQRLMELEVGGLTVAAGPNNPVGSTWIDLTREGYRIHGTPEPRLIGKTQSHGCVRLTNWDAEELARAVSAGTPVAFVG